VHKAQCGLASKMVMGLCFSLSVGDDLLERVSLPLTKFPIEIIHLLKISFIFDF